jgi:hypothetical protein
VETPHRVKIRNFVKNEERNYDPLRNHPKKKKKLTKPLPQAKLLWKIVNYLILTEITT